MSAETKSVGDGDAHVMPARLVGDVIEVAIGIGVLVVDRRMDDAAVDREQCGDRLDSAGRAKQVADHRLGAADRHLARVIAKRDLQRLRLTGVIELSRGAVRVDVVNFASLDACVLQCQRDCLGRRLAGLVRSDLVEGVIGGRVSQHLAIDPSPAIDRMLERFQDQRAGALARYEPIAVAIERTARFLRRVVARR